MLESLVGAFNAVKQATPALLVGVVLATGLLLFLPIAVTDTLGLTELRDQHRPYIGAALLIAVALLIAQALVGAVSVAKSLYSKRKERQAQVLAQLRRVEALARLTPDEKGYLLPYIADEQNTQLFSIEDGVAGGLQAKGIIYRSANVGDIVSGFAFNIQPWAREHLSANLHLLEGARLREPESRW